MDLTRYTSDADCIFIRHVLEHNVEWRRILANAVASFAKRLVLIVFTPFADTTRVIGSASHVTSAPTPDISFRKEDLTDYFKQYKYREELLSTDTQHRAEDAFYIERQPVDATSAPPAQLDRYPALSNDHREETSDAPLSPQ